MHENNSSHVADANGKVFNKNGMLILRIMHKMARSSDTAFVTYIERQWV